MYRIVKGIREIKLGGSLFDDKIKECVGKIDVEEFIKEYEKVFKRGSTLDFYDIITKKIGEDNTVFLQIIRGQQQATLKKN